ncbi:hypothetical protein CGC46_16000 [Escherichia coli O121:H19]|nr:hypothetical protein CGC46_16000 [Escherichia coli O121:H19]
MLPSETMIWQPEFTDKTLSRKTGAVQLAKAESPLAVSLYDYINDASALACLINLSLNPSEVRGRK